MNANEEIKERILEAAVEWKLSYPFQEPQITQLAAIFGISGRTLSRYYPNKEDMLGLAAMRYMQRKNDEQVKALASAKKNNGTAVEQLRSFFCTLRAAFHLNPLAIRVYAVANIKCIDYALRNQLSTDLTAEGIKRSILELLEQGKREGSIRAELDSVSAVDFMYTGFNGVMYQIAMTYTSDLSEQEKDKAERLYKEYLKMLESYVLRA